MSKYSDEFKLEVINYYFSGKCSLSGTAKKFNIPSVTSVKRWIYKYDRHGLKGILKNHRNKRERHIETWNGTKTEAQLIEEWLAYSKEIWSPKTYVSYKNYCKNIIKSIGHINLQNLNVKILEEFYKELRTKTNYSDKSIRHHYTIISTALNKAVTWGDILSNPNARIEKPKVKKKNVECYSLEDCGAIIIN